MRLSGSFVSPHSAALYQRGRERHQEQRDADRRAIAEVVVPEALVVQHVDQRIAASRRAALRQDVDQIENLERPGGLDHDEEEEDRFEVRQRFRYIVLPHLKPVLFFLIVIETAGSFQVFALVYVLTQGGPARGSYSLVYMLYDQGFRYNNFGYGAAIGVALFLMTLAAALIQRRAMGRDK